MTKFEIEKIAKNLNFRFPVIGHLIRMRAVKKLAAIGTFEVIPYMIEALNCKDFKVQEFATNALQRQKNQKAIDLLCKTWFETREESLDRIITATKYVAQKPVELRVATALKAGKLELCDNPESMDSIVSYLDDQDLASKQNAEIALRNLKNQLAIDSLCKTWLETHEESLGRIISKKKYIAQTPLELRVATALKAGKTELCDNPESVDSLVSYLSDKDLALKQNAEIALRNLTNQLAIDTLCEGITDGNYEPARAIGIECSYKPKETGRRCLFYVITGQTEEYFDLDFEFEHLRAEYIAAPEPVQQRIRTAIHQSGDRRLMGMFGEVRRRFVAKDLTEQEALLMLDVYARNRQWEEIFALLFFTPLSLVPQAIDKLAASGWEPAEEEQKALWQDLKNERKAMGSKPIKPADPEVSLGPVFAKWIERGRKEFVSKPETKLRELLQNSDPPDAVAALAAMVSKNLISDADRKFNEKHPHWLVRMAYVALSSSNHDLVLSEHPVIDMSGGGEYWLKHSPALMGQHFIQLRAASFNPEHLQQLNTAVTKKEAKDSPLKNWAMLLAMLAAYTLRNTIAIGAYEKRIEDTAISL